MDELERPEKKQVFVNIGSLSTNACGGIGGVILLGGALAAAAFASAFMIGKKRHGGDNTHRNNPIPPPPAAENKNIEAAEEDLFTSLDTNKHSCKTTKGIELKNYSESFVLDTKHGTEINGVPACDSEAASEEPLCYITPIIIPENNATSNGGVSDLPLGEHKTLLPLKNETTIVDNTKIQSPKEAAIYENGIAKEFNGYEKVKVGESRDDIAFELMGEINEKECEDTEESKGNVNGDEKQGFLSNEVGEIIHECEATVGTKKDRVEHIQHVLMQSVTSFLSEKAADSMAADASIVVEAEASLHLVKECDELDEEIITYKGEEENEDQESEVNNEEKGYIDHSKPENGQLGDSDEDPKILAMDLPEEMEVSEEDAVNEEIEVSFCQHNDTEDEVEKSTKNEVEDSSEAIYTGIATSDVGEDEDDIIDGTDGVEDLSDEAEQDTEADGVEDLSDEAEQDTKGTVDSSMESGSGGVSPAEAIQEPEAQRLKLLVNQEIEGKIHEDRTAKRGKDELHPYKNIADRKHITNGKCNSAKTFIERYVMDLATMKDYSTNSDMRKVLVVAITVLSSVSCSWFFGLSFDKLCLVVLLSIVLSKSMIVK